jgi:gamma-glutamyltranspeptidase
MTWQLPTKTESTVHYVVTDVSGNPVSTATVTMTILAPDGTTVIIGPVTLVWNATNSDYEYTILAASFTPAAGSGYTTLITVAVGGVQKNYKPIPTVIFSDTTA